MRKHMVFALSESSVTVAGLFDSQKEADKFAFEHPRADKVHLFVVRVDMYGLREVVVKDG